jgi:hypothetical protein
MSNTAFRFPIAGADENTWAQYVLAMERMNIGLNTCKLYNDGGALKLTKGRIGIDDGTQPSICEIDTITTIALTGSTSIWQEIYMTVTATTVSFTAINIAGAINAYEISSTFTNAYNAEKEGYYINADRRCIGIVWVGSTGNLDGIINTESNRQGYNGYSYVETTQTYKMVWTVFQDYYHNFIIYPIGDWNMDTTATIPIPHSIDRTKIRNVCVVIRNDSDFTYTPIEYYDGTAPSGSWECSGVSFTLRRTAGRLYDSASYNSTSYNRGWIYCELNE